MDVMPVAKFVHACYSNKKLVTDPFITEFAIMHIKSGSFIVYEADKKQIFTAGSIIFFKKNHLAKLIKVPEVDKNFESVSMILNDTVIKKYISSNHLIMKERYKGRNIFALKKCIPLQDYFDSLYKYGNGSNEGKLIEKSMVLLDLLLLHAPQLQSALLDLGMPGKIDLEAYMSKNFMFNTEIKNFAHLTGRSLASFKRDFNRLFFTSPHKWLQQKRLDMAFFMLKEKSLKPTQVYLEVGFEDLSHFSFAFKKTFGIPPSMI
ncbi:helix-turn-helix domain-containing protein [Pedobacter psychroterrae]|uniref:AraC family transcriptional regulator n=1 Tax=Pedobacter psychroterrae TaxID=2530453 RepID=A0A4R0NNQ2_9SPHI|nr:AraC family transcriptional regulator [Pedobacter psychroterrae]TCD02531.1 AraC family transcriptional regulator [Pedobacter psychroterrae]